MEGIMHVMFQNVSCSQPEEGFAFVTLRNTSFWRFLFWAEPLSRLAWLGFCPTPTTKGILHPHGHLPFSPSPSGGWVALCSGTICNNRVWSPPPAISFLPARNVRPKMTIYVCQEVEQSRAPLQQKRDDGGDSGLCGEL